jgi:acetyl esterase/lipase
MFFERKEGWGEAKEHIYLKFANMKRTTLIFAALVMVAGCGGIKISKPVLKMMLKANIKTSTELFYADSCDKRIGIPYGKGGDPAQVLDIYYADKGIRKDAVLIDIHGGFYVAGRRENNRSFASVFLREGYDVVLLEYRLNDGKRDVSDELSDCAAGLDYLVSHAPELGLNKERMFLTGDSAGGHLALYMAEGAGDASLPIRPALFAPRGVLVNCPAYDFASFGESKSFSRSALEWFIGPRYQDKEWMASMSPRTFIGSYHGPLFVSTCTNDFIRSQSLLIKADCDSLSRPLSFVDIASEDKKVTHVHNVVDSSLPESRTVNAGMIDFMNDCLPVARAK